MRVVVADATPLHYLILIGAINVLPRIFEKIHVHALDGFPHLTRVGEKTRNILALVRHPSDGFGRDRLLLKWCVLHRVSAPRWLLFVRHGPTDRPDGVPE